VDVFWDTVYNIQNFVCCNVYNVRVCKYSQNIVDMSTTFCNKIHYVKMVIVVWHKAASPRALIIQPYSTGGANVYPI